MDVPLDGILAGCFRQQVTGSIEVECDGLRGRINLRAGAVTAAKFGDTAGPPALHEMRQLMDGHYEITQRLPDLTGVLGGTSVSDSEVERVPLKALMRHCEFHALSCVITMVSRHDRAQIEYHAGELRRVELNGFYDDDAIVQVFDWTDARFRVSAPALDLDIRGWPRTIASDSPPIRTRFARGTSSNGLATVVERWLESRPEDELDGGAAPNPPIVTEIVPVRTTTLTGFAPPPKTAPLTASARREVEARREAAPVAEIPAEPSRPGFAVPARAEVLFVDHEAQRRMLRSRTLRRRRRQVLAAVAFLGTIGAVMLAML